MKLSIAEKRYGNQIAANRQIKVRFADGNDSAQRLPKMQSTT
jgi:hypothetical protein